MTDEPDTRATPIFFQRRAYRQRRMQDAARLLPVVGAALWLVPLLWPRGGAEAPLAGYALIYLFVVWLGLIVLGALLARRLNIPDAAGGEGRGE